MLSEVIFKTLTNREKVVYYFYNFNGPNITKFDKVDSSDIQFSVSKFIYISEFIYYIIYSDARFVDLYKLNTITKKHYIEYRLGKHLRINL